MNTRRLRIAIAMAAMAPFALVNVQGQMRDGMMDEQMHGSEEQKGMMMQRMHAHMGEMRERMQEMHQRMQQMDEELEDRLQAMEKAKGDARIDAMEEAIRTLVEQRKEMHEQHMRMMEGMMGKGDGKQMMRDGEE